MAWHPLPTPDGDGGPGPSRLRRSLESVLDALGGPGVDAIVTIHERWSEIVGAEMADLCRPVGIEDGTLRIRVAGPAWASHLRWAERDILARIADLVGPAEIMSITVSVGHGRRSSTSRD